MSAPQHAPDAVDPAVEERIARLERTVAELASIVSAAPGGGEPGACATSPAATPTDTSADFWALNALKERVPSPGGVVYAGSVDVGLGHVEYQWGRPTDPLLRADWAERAERIAALGHPLRLSMLHRLLDGERTVAQLVDELDLASTGIAYHHLNQLQTAGWVTSPSRGTWSVPATRIVPLLAIITAVEES